MNERAERINGWAAMIGIVAAMGSILLLVKLFPAYENAEKQLLFENNESAFRGAFFINILSV
jgi:hypothetical protein